MGFAAPLQQLAAEIGVELLGTVFPELLVEGHFRNPRRDGVHNSAPES